MRWVLEEGKKIGLVDRIQTEKVTSAQVCMWERSGYLEGRKLAFVAEAQVGHDLRKRHWGQFVKGPSLHVKYNITSIQPFFSLPFSFPLSPLHLTIATSLQTM